MKSEEKELYDVTEIGKYIVNTCLENNIFINTLKLKYLLILCQGEALKNDLCIFKETICTDIAGLTILEIEEKYNKAIAGFKDMFEIDFTIRDDIKIIIDNILQKYGKFSPSQLEGIFALTLLNKKFKSDGSIRKINNLEVTKAFNSTFTTENELDVKKTSSRKRKK